MKVVEFNKLKEILVGNGIETVFEIYGNGQFKLHISFKNFGRTYDFKYPTTVSNYWNGKSYSYYYVEDC